MAENNIIYTITDPDRGNLNLAMINNNSTVLEMVKTINKNFQNIAEHGGGPAGRDGADGLNGVDGSNVEYIFALCDTVAAGVHYPPSEDVSELNRLFNEARDNNYADYKSVRWYNHAQPLSEKNKNEYVFSRIKREIPGQGVSWYYVEKPVLWSHWGETGLDGDGVEYIFLVVDHMLTDNELEASIKKQSTMTKYQKLIFNYDDFYPGKGWFNDTNREKVWEDFVADPSIDLTRVQFVSNWNSYFDFPCDLYDWSDNPTGTSVTNLYEYVSIRRSNTNENDKKVWGDFGTPAIWANYSSSTRTFIIYYNSGTETTAPQPTGGWWDTVSDRLVVDKPGKELTEGWSDTNSFNTSGIIWLCSGVFATTGENISWSAPARITGADGKDGKDGSDIEFIYCLSDSMAESTNYPAKGEGYANWKKLFDSVEDPEHPAAGMTIGTDANGDKYVDWNGTHWYDRARMISAENKTEYCWSRKKSLGNDDFDYYDPKPFVWAHWGEDGTDGDGVEYIFRRTTTSTNPGNPGSTPWNNKTFQDDDYVPENWSDNPIGIDVNHPYEWVSIRKTVTVSGVQQWGDFSYPALWSSYSKRVRIFIVYRNMPSGQTPSTPAGGWWDVEHDTLVKNHTDHELTQDWTDENVEESGKITWMSTGTFFEDNFNNSWSAPNRITGANGLNGADGSNIEFIYCLADSMTQGTNYPVAGENYVNWKMIFDMVENPEDTTHTGDMPVYPSAAEVPVDAPNIYAVVAEKYVHYKGTDWYDTARVISPEHKTEYCWSRTKAAGTNNWTYVPAPFVWAHWGEDGTDGDGIEYIFRTTTTSTNPGDPGNEPFNNKTFQDDDYVPENWTDNPSGVDETNKYEWVSVRKSSNNVSGKRVWNAFETPALWSKYSVSKFTSFAFTATTPDVDLSGCTVSGGLYNSPIPTLTKRGNNNVNIEWHDGPSPSGINTEIWMVSAQFSDDVTGPVDGWSSPKRMTDSNTFQVEWSSDDKSNAELVTINNTLANSAYDFGTFLAAANYVEATAETNWRTAVRTATGIQFDDSSENAVLMATCQMKNGSWTHWTVKRVKGEQGEKGDDGTSIKITDKITYEVYFGDDTGSITSSSTYNKSNAQLAQSSHTYSPEPSSDNLVIVYPENVDSDDIYWGDDNYGGALYMWKYNGTTWEDYSTSSNGEDIGNAYISPNGHLILWDGDSWQDVGKIVGPKGDPGDDGKTYALLVKYANDGNNNTKVYVTGDAIPYAKWIGVLTYVEGEEGPETILPSDSRWQWSLFKGQDGYGYEYIYIANNDKTNPPAVPTTTTAQDSQTDYVPTNWDDDPIEPTSSNKYVWMCWRKYDYSTRKWSKFIGADGKTSTEQNAVARLWQFYVNGISTVTEYFHADTSVSPSDTTKFNGNPTLYPTYWKSTKSDWDSTNRYLFNVEVITYTDGTTKKLDPHFVAVYADGIKDILDYYCLDTDGSSAPNYSKSGDTVTITTSGSSSTEGKAWWTQNVKKTPISSSYPYLWNINKKTYEDNTEEWTTPHVIGVYGEGGQGEDSIYLDLDNEMDTTQVTDAGKVIRNSSYTTTLHMYSGSNLVKMKSCQISGEDISIFNGKITLEYRANKGVGSWSSYSDGTIITSGFDELRMTLTLQANDSLTKTENQVTRLVEYAKIQFIVTSVNDYIRSTAYTFIASTNPSVFSIVPSDNILIEKTVNGVTTVEPSSITFKVVEKFGSSIVDHSSNVSGDGGFQLKMTVNDSTVAMPSNYVLPTMSNGSPLFSAGDKLTFTVHVDTPNSTGRDSDETPDIVMDTETIYVVKHGSDGAPGTPGTPGTPGAPGAAGNGYEYVYVQYNNASESSYGTTTCTVSQATPSSSAVFKIGNLDVTSTVTSYAKGVDASHTYEFRSERFGYSGNWTKWSNPVTIAKYLTTDNISSEISSLVSSMVSSATSGINTRLDQATTAINDLSECFDENGKLDASRFPTTVLNGYMSTAGDVAGAINSIGVGMLKVDGSGNVYLSSLLSDMSQGIATVGASYSAIEGSLSQYATNASLADVADAVQNFKVDASNRFASIESTVANGKYLTDTYGNLLADIPAYTTWFNNETSLSGDTRPIKWVIATVTCQDPTDPDGETFEDFTSLVPDVASIDKLHNEDGTKWVFIFRKNINASTDLYDHLINQSFSDAFYENIIVYLNKDTGVYTCGLESGETSLPDNPLINVNTIYNPYYNPRMEGASEIIIEMYTTVDITDGTYNNVTGNYEFSYCSWTFGVYDPSNLGIGGVYRDIAFAKTEDIFTEPYTKPYAETYELYDDIIINAKKYGNYGYTLAYDTDTDSVKEIDKYGILSVNNPNAVIVPATESMTNVMNYLKGTANPYSGYSNVVKNIAVGETNTYYVLCRNNNLTNDSFEYTTTLTDNPADTTHANTFSFNSGNNPFVLNDKLVNVSQNQKFQDDSNDNSYRSGFFDNEDESSMDAYEEYSLYITSELDEVNLTYKFDSETREYPEPEESEPEIIPEPNVNISVTYWYEGEFANRQTINLEDDSHINASMPTYVTQNLFANTLLEPYKVLHFRYVVNINEDVSSLTTSYKFNTKNKFMNDYTESFISCVDGVENNIEFNATESEGYSYQGYISGSNSYTLKDVNKFEIEHNSEDSCDIINAFLISSNNKNTRYYFDINLSKFQIDENHPRQTALDYGTFKYVLIPKKYTSGTLNALKIYYDYYYHTQIFEDFGLFWEKPQFGTGGLKKEIFYELRELSNGFATYLPNSMDESFADVFNDDFESFYGWLTIIEASSNYTGGITKYTEIADQCSEFDDFPYITYQDFIEDIIEECGYTIDEVEESRDVNADDLIELTSPNHKSRIFDFNNGEYDEKDGKYYYTVFQIYSNNSHTIFNFDETISLNAVDQFAWTTDTDNATRKTPEHTKYGVIDQITVTVNDRSDLNEHEKYYRRNALDHNENPTPHYTEVRDEDRPYLILTVDEVSSISQTVNNGIACTSIVTTSNGNTAAQVFEADTDGSTIYMMADRVGIKSNHFILDDSGVTVRGDVYATDGNNNITAGVIGRNEYPDTGSDVVDEVKFFAGTSIEKINDNYPTLQSDIDRAPFRVTEQGYLYARRGQIGKMNITPQGLKYEGEGNLLYISDEGITIKDNDGNVSTLSANGIDMTGTFKVKSTNLVCNLYGPEEDIENLKKSNIYSAVDGENVVRAFAKYDIINIAGRMSVGGTFNIEIPGDSSLVGRRFTIMAEPPTSSDIITELGKYSNVTYIAGPPSGQNLPAAISLKLISGAKFYVDGGKSSSIKLYKEAVELLGIGGIDGELDGFIVLNRYDINNTGFDSGHELRCLGMFKIDVSQNVPIITQKTYNGKQISVSYTDGNSYFTITTPFVSPIYNAIVTVSPEIDATSIGNGITYATSFSNSGNALIIKVTSTSATNIKKPLTIMVYNMMYFSNLNIDTNIYPSIIAKEYKQSNKSSWNSLPISGITWKYSDKTTYDIRVKVNSSIRRVECTLTSGQTDFDFVKYYANQYAETSGNDYVNICSITPKYYNHSTITNNVGAIKITAYSSTTIDSSTKSVTYTIPLTQTTEPRSSGGGSGGSSGGDYNFYWDYNYR